MQVYSDFELAKKEMANLAQKHNQVVSLVYIVYGNNPHKLEYKLCFQDEFVCDVNPPNCMCDYLNGFGYIEFQSLEDVERKLGNVRHNIISTHKCGDMPMRGCSSSVDEVVFNNI